MPIPVIARAVTAVAFAATAATYVVADLKGDYKIEFVVQESTYTGSAKAAAGSAKGAFTAKFEFTSPSTATADVTGKTAGDSIAFDAKYVDNGRNCTGTLTGKGTIEKDGSKAQGDLAINDSCGGETTGTFKLWR
jgi:hypothetical protein